jgi:hypothetical protein
MKYFMANIVNVNANLVFCGNFVSVMSSIGQDIMKFATCIYRRYETLTIEFIENHLIETSA